MVDVVVVGGGLAGMAAAARIAKLRHRVVLLESSETLGGGLLPFDHAGYSFDHGLSEITLPATLRDLFRKSGRPLDRVLDLQPLAVARRHVFGHDLAVDLPAGSRGEQTRAIDDALGAGAGARWTHWLDTYGAVWEVLRRSALEQRFTGRDAFTRSEWRVLRPRTGLDRATRRGLRDPFLRAMVLDRHRLDGQQVRRLPSLLGVVELVERSFGRWRIDGGTIALVQALERRLDERRVEVRRSVQAHDVARRGSAVVGVDTDDGIVESDVVVWAAPRGPGDRTETDALPRVPATRTYLGLAPSAPRVDQQVVVHDHAPVRVTPSATHAGPGQAWTVEHLAGEDPVRTLARHGIDVTDHVATRVDRSSVDLVRAGARYGWAWAGWRTALTVPGVGALRDGGLLRIGVNAHPGWPTELVALGAAAAAETLREPSEARGSRAR